MNVRLPVAAGGLALALLVTADADADTVTVADKSEKNLLAGVDLDGAQYSNDVAGFTARVRVRNLKQATNILGFTITGGKGHETYHLAFVRKASGAERGKVSVDHGDGQLQVTCSDLDAYWDNALDRIDVSVPWKCLGKSRTTLRVQGYFGAGNGSHGDPDDFLKTVEVRYR